MRYLMVLCLCMLAGCAGIQGKRVSSQELGYKEQLVFSDSPEVVFDAVRKSIYELQWESLYSGGRYPDYNYAGLSYQVSDGDANAESWKQIKKESIGRLYKVVQAKTPTFPFSYGAILYISINKEEPKTYVSVIAGSSQINEAKKLEGYVKIFIEKLNKNIQLKQ